MPRHLVLPVLLAASLGLTACGAGDATSPDATVGASPTVGGPTTAHAPSGATPIEAGSATEPIGGDTVPDGDCSASGLAVGDADLAPLPDEARATAQLLLDAALRCDEQLLAPAAVESDTRLTFGQADPYEFFGLPDTGDEVYAVIATLLSVVPYAAEADDSTPATFVWPRVQTGDWATSDEAWQEVVDAGLVTAEEAADMRAAGAGYLGWRLAITGDGTWTYLVAGD